MKDVANISSKNTDSKSEIEVDNKILFCKHWLR